MKKHVYLRMLEPDCCWGGCENRILDYFKKADYTKNEITVVTNIDIFSDVFKRENLPVKVLDFPFKFEGSFFKRFSQVRSFLKELKPDNVIFIQGAFTDFLLSEFLAAFFVVGGRVYDLEVLGAPRPDAKNTEHSKSGLGLWWYKKMFSLAMRGWLCKRILSVSNEVKDRLVKWYRYPKKRIFNVYHGIDIDKFSFNEQTRQALRVQYGINDEDTVILCASRLADEKCIHRVINAFDQLAEDFDKLKLFVIGDGPKKNDFMALAESKASNENIKFLGFQEDVENYLSMADIYVLPSRIEGLGRGLLEALAVGLISVATKTPGPAEIVDNDINGILVENRDDTIYEGLKKALNLSEDAKLKMKQNARKTVEENFELNERVLKAVELLELV